MKESKGDQGSLSSMADKRVSVGVSFPARIGTVTAIWPLGIVVIGDSGVGVDVRPAPFKRLLMRFIDPRPGGDAPLWKLSWNELSVVDVGPRSALLRAEGSRGCRVVLVRRRHLRFLLNELSSRQIASRRVTTTFGWYFR